MSKFHEEFFEDLREDLLIRGKNSILYQYFYKEKEEHPFVKIKRCLYELQKGEFIRKNAISQMQEDLTENQSFKKVLDELGEYPTQKGYLNKEQQMFWLENLYALLRKPTNAQKAVRRKSSEHICIDLLCEYYEIKRMQIIQSKGNRPLEMELQSIETFLADAEAALKKSKAGKQRKEALRKAIDELRYQPDMEHVIRVKDQTLELYLYGDVAQYLYNVGYPLPRDDNSMLENIAPRVKTNSGKIIRLLSGTESRVLFTVGVSEIDKIIQKISIDTMQEYIICYGIMNCVKLSFHCRLIRNRESVFMCLERNICRSGDGTPSIEIHSRQRLRKFWEKAPAVTQLFIFKISAYLKKTDIYGHRIH